MNDLQYCIENFHKPRMAKLAEFLLTESEFDYDFIEPPVFETYMIQIKLNDDLRLCINYFPIEITDQAPYLFLQLHCVLADLEKEPSEDLLRYLSLVNNNTELSAYQVDESRLFLKSVMIDDPEAALNTAQIGFLLRIFYSNLMDHREGFQVILDGGSYADAVK